MPLETGQSYSTTHSTSTQKLKQNNHIAHRPDSYQYTICIENYTLIHMLDRKKKPAPAPAEIGGGRYMFLTLCGMLTIK